MKSERGGIVVYLIIGLVLFGALLGGVWWVKQRTVVAGDATQKTTTPGTSQTDTQVSQDAQPERDATSEEATSTPTPAASSADYPQQTSSTATTQSSTTATIPSPSSSGSTAAAGNKPVANTGPAEDAALTAVALATLSYVAVAYVRSRSIVG